MHAEARFVRWVGPLCDVLVVAIAVVGVTARSASAHRPSVKVMTQNLYEGTEFRDVSALRGTHPSLSQGLAAATADYGTYLETRFRDRAAEIGAEIARDRPDVVGLQEVATWHRGAFEPLGPFGMPAHVSEDFARELVAAIARNGAGYAVVSRRENFNVAFPIITPAGLVAVGMVEGGVILARQHLRRRGLALSNARSGTYVNRPPFIPNPAEPNSRTGLQLTNSWQAIDVRVRGRPLRFITTHLDAVVPTGLVAGRQAIELLGGPARRALPLLVAGDFNSGPLIALPPASVPAGADFAAAYNALIAGGLTDTWTAAGLGPAPLTCCHDGPDDLLRDPSAIYTEDPDHIFSRGDLQVLDEHLVGNTAANPTRPGFIWPSDHAGLVATIGVGPQR